MSKKPWTIEQLSATVETVPGLTFGYIGNLDAFGYDDRLFIIWVDGVKDHNGTAAKLWQCSAMAFNSTAWMAAHQKIQSFELGKQYVANLKEDNS